MKSKPQTKTNQKAPGRIPEADPKAPMIGDSGAALPFVFDRNDPAVQKLLAGGIPADRLRQLSDIG